MPEKQLFLISPNHQTEDIVYIQNYRFYDREYISSRLHTSQKTIQDSFYTSKMYSQSHLVLQDA